MPLTPPRTNTGQRVPFSLCPRTGERVRASRSLHRVNYFKDGERSEHRVLVDDSRRVRELSFPGVKRRRPLHSSERFAAGDFPYSLFRSLPSVRLHPEVTLDLVLEASQPRPNFNAGRHSILMGLIHTCKASRKAL